MTTIFTGPSKQKTPLRLLIAWQVALVLITFASYYLRSITDSLLLYLPIALSIVLIHWHGWRMLIIIYINSIFTLFLWKAQGPLWWILLMATHEPVIAIASKVLVDFFIKITHAELFKNTRTFILFIIFGILLPTLSNSFFVYHYSFVNGDLERVALFLLSDILTVTALSIPVLYFFKPSSATLVARNWPTPLFVKRGTMRLTSSAWEFFLALGFFVVLHLFTPFEKYWFIYWIGAVIVALRQGFEWAILTNFSIFIIAYLLPLVIVLPPEFINTSSTQLVNIHVGSVTMMAIALLVGRVVSDLRESEDNLVAQKVAIEKANQQLSQTNLELDRFVYSVSHDLSAPLKSIKGLINISKMESSDSPVPYFDKIEKSVAKLEVFIEEVLDYSRTNRKELVNEPIHLPELYKEILDKFTYLDRFEKIKFSSTFEVEMLYADKFLIKVILGNLISNAIKYQRTYSEHEAIVELTSSRTNGQVRINVRDNGEGIRQENQGNLFRMFYRATSSSSGSGLGLYIAREAAKRLGGTLTMESVYGEGSTLTLVLKDG